MERAASTRPAVGGVTAEFKTAQRCVTRLDPPVDGFFSSQPTFQSKRVDSRQPLSPRLQKRRERAMHVLFLKEQKEAMAARGSGATSAPPA